MAIRVESLFTVTLTATVTPWFAPITYVPTARLGPYQKCKPRVHALAMEPTGPTAPSLALHAGFTAHIPEQGIFHTPRAWKGASVRRHLVVFASFQLLDHDGRFGIDLPAVVMRFPRWKPGSTSQCQCFCHEHRVP